MGVFRARKGPRYLYYYTYISSPHTMTFDTYGHRLSSHINGRPRFRLLFNVIFFYFGIAVFMFYLGYLSYTTAVDRGDDVFVNVALVLFLLGIIAIIPGIWQLAPETVEFDGNSITMTKWPKHRILAWPQVREVAIVSALGYYSTPTTNPMIRVRTDDMTLRLHHWTYGIEDLKAVAVPMATYAKHWNVKIFDELGWLPDHLYTKEEGFKSKIEEYRLILRIGGYIALTGLILMPLAIFVEWIILPCVMCLFIGGFVALAGGVGVNDEKGKLALHEHEKKL